MPQHATMLEDNDRKTSAPKAIPKWLPRDANSYLQHVCLGLSIRELARRSDCHASTILRQIRKIEAERDDPLKDEALERLSAVYPSFAQVSPINTEQEMSSVATREVIDSDVEVEKEARRILRRLCETHSFLLVSPEMEKAAVFRETVPGRRTRIAVVDREIAQVFALKDWIEGHQSGRVGSTRLPMPANLPSKDCWQRIARTVVQNLRTPKRPIRFKSNIGSLEHAMCPSRVRCERCAIILLKAL